MRKSYLCTLTLLVAWLHSAEAQQAPKIPRIGWFTAAPHSSMAVRAEAFRRGLRERGYVEGKNIVIEWRSPEGKPNLMPTIATELVRLKVDVIVTAGEGVTRYVKEATSTIPIVMAQDPDPVGSGFVATLARPGGNIITGLATLAPELSGKQLELLKETVPKVSRIAVFCDFHECGLPAHSEGDRASRGRVHRDDSTRRCPKYRGYRDGFPSCSQGAC